MKMNCPISLFGGWKMHNKLQQLAKECPNVEFTIQPHENGQWWAMWNSDEFDGFHYGCQWNDSFHDAVQFLMEEMDKGRIVHVD
jgi:hypothetical protein